MTSNSARRRVPRGGKPTGPKVRQGTLRVQHEVARRLRGGHPWVYNDSLRRNQTVRTGDAVQLVDWDGEFIAHALLEADANICARIVSWREDQPITAELIAARVTAAIKVRRDLMSFAGDDALRLVNAENDGLPAICIDRYGEHCIVHAFSEALAGHLDTIYDAVVAELSPKSIYLQRRYRSLAGEAPRQGAELVRGEPAPIDLTVTEGPLSFVVDVTAPLSTGLFPDLREGRRAIARWAKDRRVLNLFSYTGAISVYALHGGATEVVSVDVSAKSHERARRNMVANHYGERAAEFVTADAMKTLTKMQQRGRKFDMVVIDPPAFGRASKGAKVWSATRDYVDLAAAALEVLVPGGVLVAASTTHKLSLGDFEIALSKAASRTGTRLRIVERPSLPPDFPTSPGFPEANYLKCVVVLRD